MTTADLARFRRTFARARLDAEEDYDPGTMDDTWKTGLALASWLIAQPDSLCAACGGPSPVCEGWVTLPSGNVWAYAMCGGCFIMADTDARSARVDENFNRLRGVTK